MLCLRSASGTPVLETLAESFASIAAAERFARDRLDIDVAHVRIKVRNHA